MEIIDQPALFNQGYAYMSAMENKSIPILESALAYLEHGWCRRHAAILRIGWWFELPVDATSRMANSFCSLGAVSRAVREIVPDDPLCGSPQSTKALGYLARAIGADLTEGVFLSPIYQPIMAWNDAAADQQEILAGFRRAIALAREDTDA